MRTSNRAFPACIALLLTFPASYSITESPASATEALILDLPTRFPAAPRVVAIGDLHGDLSAARAALRLAGAIDDGDRWIGGELVVVQTGDVLDRGGDEIEILDLLDSVAEQARATGGALHALNGNHELMNAQKDFRYVTVEGFLDFVAKGDVDYEHPSPQSILDGLEERTYAMRPGGEIALRLATRNVITMVGDTLFVHGGVLPHVANYGIERLNQETRNWLRAETACPPGPLFPSDGPVWSRHYSSSPGEEECRLLEETLSILGAARIVVGHSVKEEGITSACDGRAWMIDVGMAEHYGGSIEVLELTPQGVRALREKPLEPQQPELAFENRPTMG